MRYPYAFPGLKCVNNSRITKKIQIALNKMVLKIMLYPISTEIHMKNNTLSRIGMAGACAGLLSLAVAAKAAEPYQAIPPLTQQCGLALNPQVDAAAKPYLEGLVAVAGPKPTWLASVCPGASTNDEEGLYRVKAALGAHLLHEVSTKGTLSDAQRKSVRQSLDVAKGLWTKKNQLEELVYVNVRSNAAHAGIPADGLAYQLKDKAPAVAKTLDSAALRWGP